MGPRPENECLILSPSAPQPREQLYGCHVHCVEAPDLMIPEEGSEKCLSYF